ncbi:hypothetical protein [Geminicoccus roseus]|uniref:hypothetical protein n=1 Tax=Geminicoccus roseus TaxID=404900 RepID=UPI0004045363|nr:hypothetical protein [Geminicoccus roseus]
MRIVLLVLLAALAASPASAQSVDELRRFLRQSVADAHVGDLVQGLTGFAALPGVSAANFTIDAGLEGGRDTQVTKFVLPLRHDFPDLLPAGRTLYAELTLGYLHADDGIDDFLLGTPLEADVDSDLDAVSAVAGLGVSFPLGAHATLRPIGLIGYSYIGQDSQMSGPGAALLEETTEGFLFNLHGNVALAGAALQANYRREIGGGVHFAGNLRYNQLFAETFAASDDVLKTSSTFGVFTALGELNGPLPGQVFGRDLRWIGFVANSSFPGNASDSLGFDYFFEFGGGIEIVDDQMVDGIDGISLRASALVGDGITGWSVGAKLEF